ncbi:hypothetical protein MTR67_048689 [Solanum verrucosum]|uniref:Reverse transcriptase/retrotransposon-derived protein RNase H-like domain-containing protein n=1 Tax=Solanum verrucosum TaxID=315347 RepID=A0AAF0V199_SOLVR|nr:hypothetical protein MTR67_048689 [Solanum verrucosum]
MLTLLEGTDEFVVYYDASRIGLGYVLMQNDYYMSVLYLPVKENVVTDALSRLSIGSVAHVEEDKKELVRDVHRLARLGFDFLTPPKVVLWFTMVQNRLLW